MTMFSVNASLKQRSLSNGLPQDSNPGNWVKVLWINHLYNPNLLPTWTFWPFFTTFVFCSCHCRLLMVLHLCTGVPVFPIGDVNCHTLWPLADCLVCEKLWCDTGLLCAVQHLLNRLTCECHNESIINSQKFQILCTVLRVPGPKKCPVVFTIQ